MRTIFQVFGVHGGREKDVYFGAFRTIEEANAEISKLHLREMNGHNWAQQYHDKGFSIRPTIVTTEFEIPPLPKPRDKYVVACSAKPNRPGTWDSTRVEVFRRGFATDANHRICEYERNYSMLQTFEPFRQGGREFALISRDYMKTAVLDLVSGEVIAEEDNGGFCPVGFYVPDWWDVHNGSKLPGSEFWSADDEWPTGNFGFVWGCVWGDDSSWKVNYLDLSRIQEGKISRDLRFGYVELATGEYRTPCLIADSNASPNTPPPNFIALERYEGVTKVTFAVEMRFDLESGKSDEWKRD